MEALVRWRKPDGTLVGPDSFIALAEETGLIVPLGTWVLQAACSQNKAWQDAGLPKLSVAVNLSPRQFRQEDIARQVQDALTGAGLAAHFLELEITESEIQGYYFSQPVPAGQISTAQAQKTAMAAIKNMRYEAKEYFWINDMQPKILMHPIKPELDGTDVSNIKDATGKRFIVACVETVKAHGASFVYYLRPKPGFDDPVQKLSYVKGFAPWGWIIGWASISTTSMRSSGKARANTPW